MENHQSIRFFEACLLRSVARESVRRLRKNLPGFRTFRVLELALYHSLGKLPEPELTHEFS
jgi:hypothetical protein